MLDLAFLVLMVFVLARSIKGNFNQTLCNVAMVIGICASVIGGISVFFSDMTAGMGVLYIIEFIIAIILKPVAMKFVQLYQDKIDEETRSYREQVARIEENLKRTPPRDSTYISNNAPQQRFSDASIQAGRGSLEKIISRAPKSKSTAAMEEEDPSRTPQRDNSYISNSAAQQTSSDTSIQSERESFEEIISRAPESKKTAAMETIELSSPAAPAVPDASLAESASSLDGFGEDLLAPSGLDEIGGIDLPYDLSAPIDLNAPIDLSKQIEATPPKNDK